ncbi:hypothetical protein ACLOJK_001283 [Asimina triloba]
MAIFFTCRHRRDRESSILKIIESGGETLFDIVAKVYANVDITLWLPASSNVRLHLDFLAYQDKLPKVTLHLLQRTEDDNVVKQIIWRKKFKKGLGTCYTLKI